MILIKMGVCELLYFETIPTKVTINEYIDLAKDYSTAQSGHFVNGILDGVHKDLTTQNKIFKTDFKSKKANWYCINFAPFYETVIIFYTRRQLRCNFLQ